MAFDDRFARVLPEIAIPWQAEEAPDPALLVLNESLSTELGLAPEWLRSFEGVCLLIGHLVPSGVTPVALLPLLHPQEERAVELATEALDAFPGQYDAAWSAGVRAKLGLPDGVEQAVVSALVAELLILLQEDRVDHTSFFRSLSAAARGDAEAARGGVLQLGRSIPGSSAGSPWLRTPT